MEVQEFSTGGRSRARTLKKERPCEREEGKAGVGGEYRPPVQTAGGDIAEELLSNAYSVVSLFELRERRASPKRSLSRWVLSSSSWKFLARRPRSASWASRKDPGLSNFFFSTISRSPFCSFSMEDTRKKPKEKQKITRYGTTVFYSRNLHGTSAGTMLEAIPCPACRVVL